MSQRQAALESRAVECREQSRSMLDAAASAATEQVRAEFIRLAAEWLKLAAEIGNLIAEL